MPRQNNDRVPIVALGDSHANAMAGVLRNDYTRVVNLGEDGRNFRGLTPQVLNQIPDNSIVLISMGTNDVSRYLNGGDVNGYARNLVSMAARLRDQGHQPAIIGIQSITAPYTENPINVTSWNRGVSRLNAAIEAEARRQGINYSPSENVIPRSERAADNLHYTSRGYSFMARYAVERAQREPTVRRVSDLNISDDNIRLSAIDLRGSYHAATNGLVSIAQPKAAPLDFTTSLSGKYLQAATGLSAVAAPAFAENIHIGPAKLAL